MPKEIKDIKDFLLIARRKDAKSVIIKRNPERGTRSRKYKIQSTMQSLFIYMYVLSIIFIN